MKLFNYFSLCLLDKSKNMWLLRKLKADLKQFGHIKYVGFFGVALPDFYIHYTAVGITSHTSYFLTPH